MNDLVSLRSVFMGATLCFCAGASAAAAAAERASGVAVERPIGAAAVVAAPALSERQKINALIASVEQLRGAVFIRNGTEYDGGKAAAHLRRKLGAAGKRVTTAEQFITHLATGSSMTGKAYTIRFADGRTVESAAYFRGELKRLEAARTSAKG